MKRLKYLSLILAFAMMLGACNGKEPSETTAEATTTAETTTEATTEPTTEATTEPTTEATTEPETGFTEDTVYDDIKINDYISVSRKGNIFIPQFLLEGADFEKANKEIEEFASEIVAADPAHNFRYAFIKADSRRYSLVIYVQYAWEEAFSARAYTFDTTTNEILDNDTILGLADEPLSEFYDDAHDSLKVILDERGSGYSGDEYETSLSSERINKDMMMFLGKGDDLFLGSEVASLGGATSYFEIWDLDGKCWSSACKLDAVGMADYFVVDIANEKSNSGSVLYLTYMNTSSNKLEFYNVIDGELTLTNSLPLGGGKYVNYADQFRFEKADGTSINYVVDQDGKIVEMAQ